MIKYISLFAALALSGCQTIQVAKDVGCSVVTEESRAEIRDKQKVKTDICGDLK